MKLLSIIYFKSVLLGASACCLFSTSSLMIVIVWQSFCTSVMNLRMSWFCSAKEYTLSCLYLIKKQLLNSFAFLSTVAIYSFWESGSISLTALTSCGSDRVCILRWLSSTSLMNSCTAVTSSVLGVNRTLIVVVIFCSFFFSDLYESIRISGF